MELEEIIKYIENIINATYITATLKDKDGNIIEEGLVNQQVIQDLLDLYNKEKQENDDLKENSIPKKKIEDKLFEECLNYFKATYVPNYDGLIFENQQEKYFPIIDERERKIAKIQVLQELLEEGDE